MTKKGAGALALLAACVFVLWGAPRAFAYVTLKGQSGDELRWNAADMPVKWYTHSDRLSQSPGFSEVSWADAQNALRLGFAAWQNVPCSTLTFSYEGAADPDYEIMGSVTPDYKNVLAFPDAAHWPSEWSGAYAVTIPLSATSDGHLLDADMLFSPNFTWSTAGDGPSDTADLQNIATHEIGHVLGLDHPSPLEATMYYACLYGETYKRTLAPDDIQGLCHLYPRAKATGLPCTTGAECTGGLCEADAASGGSVCSEPCTCPTDCPVPMGCTDGKCLPPGPDLGSIGYACDTSLPCEGNGLCVSGMCSRSCQSAGDCPADYPCMPLVGGGSACYSSAAPKKFAPGTRQLLAAFSISPMTNLAAHSVIRLSASPVRKFPELLYRYSATRDDGSVIVIQNYSKSSGATYTLPAEGSYTLRVELATDKGRACADDRREIEIDVGAADGDDAPQTDGDSDADTAEREYDFPKDWVTDTGPGPACQSAGPGAAGGLCLCILLFSLFLRRKKTL